MARTSSEAVANLESAVRAWAATAEDVARQASAVVRRLVSDGESEVQDRMRRVRALEAALAGARAEARARLARELQAATTALEAARRGLRQAKDAESRMQVLQRRINEATTTRTPRASSALKQKLAALERYKDTSVTAGGSGGSANPPLWKELVISGVTAVSAITHQVPGLVPQEAQLEQTHDTASSQQVNPAATTLGDNALHRLDQHQLDESFQQLEHVYSEEKMKEARERNRHLGEPDFHG
jgi:hypothetical protein